MSPLAGLAMSFAIVAVLVLPVRLGGTLIGTVAGSVNDGGATSDQVARQIEAEYIATVHQGSLVATDPAVGSTSSVPANLRNYPDNYRPPRKEVGQAGPNGRPPEAI
jgi:hypothetical protein